VIRVGIGGWDFAPWRGGTFYPKDLPRKEELPYASRQLTSIEVNATFYGRQKPETFQKWRAATPDDFVFSLKGPRFVTQGQELGRGLDAFLESGIDELGPKLGTVLWQLRKRPEEGVLAAFLEKLPKNLKHAVELAHPGPLDLFRKHGVAVAVIDDDGYELIDEPTGPFVYARLKASPYSAKQLDEWAARFRGRDGFVYFISGEKERAPEMAMALIERLGR
jgi:uncharacterized protein YecE (DUF72 family)